ncbi:hypothetical protein [Halorussus sp. AFM4]|uniref:hypothetical protein n=1 Tax=Halorussus sp. AFM4 TaxID=3421651 RepID=UPI003EC0C9FD
MTGRACRRGREDFDDDLDTAFELCASLDAFAADTDADGPLDGHEVELGTDSLAGDTDGDRLDDQQEVSLGPAVSNPASPLEVRYATSNPGEVDTDGDALDDREERGAETSAFLRDTDYDYLGDGEEVNEVGTDPLTRDTDSDYLLDGTEAELIHLASNPRKTVMSDPSEADTDGDGLLDGAEVENDVITRRSAPENTHRVYSDPDKRDTDGDSIPDADEAQLGTDAWKDDTDGDTLPDPVDANPTTPDEVNASASELDKALAFSAGATLGEWGFPNDKRADSPYYMAGWMTASVAPGVDVATGVRDLVAAVKEGKSFDAALEAVGLIPVLGKVGDAGKVVDVAKTYVKAFPSKAADAQRVVSDVVLRHSPDGYNARIYRALGADEAVTRLRSNGLSNADLETLVGRLDESESLSDVVWATKHGDQIIHLTKSDWEHILKRHVKGTEKSNGYTTFFPTGNVIKATDERPKHVLLNRMSVADVQDSITETIARADSRELIWKDTDAGEWRGLAYRVDNSGEYGIDSMRVVVRPPGHSRAGRIVTAHPEDGPAVATFNTEDWV